MSSSSPLLRSPASTKTSSTLLLLPWPETSPPLYLDFFMLGLLLPSASARSPTPDDGCAGAAPLHQELGWPPPSVRQAAVQVRVRPRSGSDLHCSAAHPLNPPCSGRFSPTPSPRPSSAATSFLLLLVPLASRFEAPLVDLVQRHAKSAIDGLCFPSATSRSSPDITSPPRRRFPHRHEPATASALRSSVSSNNSPLGAATH